LAGHKIVHVDMESVPATLIRMDIFDKVSLIQVSRISHTISHIVYGPLINAPPQLMPLSMPG